MPEPDPFADDPHDVIGVEPGATAEEIRVAAAKAKRMYNPEARPEDERETAREAFYEIKAAEAELLDDARNGDEPAALELNVPSEAETGDLRVRVDRENGEAAEGVAVVVARADGEGSERTATTDDEGYATLRVPTAGEYEVTASVEGTVERATVIVEPRVVSPDVVLDDDWVVGEPATVAVSVEGEPVAGALVGVGDDLEETNVDGIAEFRPETAGEQRVTVTVENTDRRTVRDWVGEVEVARAVAPLTVTVDDPVAVGTETRVRVTADGDPVDGAVVGSVDDRLVAETRDRDPPETTDGTATVQFTESGDTTVYADCEADADREYRRGETDVSVWPAEPTATVAVTPTDPALGQTMTLTVRREFDGGPVREGTVIVERDGDRVHRAETDARGEVTFTPKASGDHRVRVRFEPPAGDTGEATATVRVSDREVPTLELYSDRLVDPGGRVSFRVVGRESGDPLPDTMVMCRRVDRDGQWLDGDKGETGADGTVTFELPEHGATEGNRAEWRVWAAPKLDGERAPDAHPLNSDPETVYVVGADETEGLLNPATVTRLVREAATRGSITLAVVGIAASVGGLYVESLGVATVIAGLILAVSGGGAYLWLQR